MKSSLLSSTKEEVRKKLLLLYSDTIGSGRNVLDFDKSYDFFSLNESLVLKFSSNWFRPEKYNSPLIYNQTTQHFGNVSQDEAGNSKRKEESLSSNYKPMTSMGLTTDLEVLGKTPYQIGVDGEKFRVVAATLQKCNSPFIRRTFHFTSNGIVETPEKKEESDLINVIPFLKQTKNGIPQQKFVRIRRFKVVKKEDLTAEKCVWPQKIRITNSEKTRFLTVRIRSTKSGIAGKEIGTSIVKLEKDKTEASKEIESMSVSNANSAVQTEEVEESEQVELDGNESDISTVPEHAAEDKVEKVEEMTTTSIHQEEKIKDNTDAKEIFNCDSCGKQFTTYFNCLMHVRSHQRHTCNICAKRFLTAKLVRDHVKIHHQEVENKSKGPEDRITTATSKFGRTRQVLNVAGLRSKYKML